ncbi:DUF58 domain-containing protein [Deinococcus peraridilitoris]|uniref:Uncharacterized protein n=1 Tax=Deinococcus peraridilitoris (strain DSM 19664 / LMG 22246 / CIP 109416 / KR-200) TaxID=937777 RepID=K9ZZD8_DEIPD|nr:DUF58 domain-containing protein [Deinococcus peraridilitoris]AFZ66564.1 hypothetical protein Deipe_1000 [Deinococcus peraridilitoris DSM 19664]
MKRTTLRRHPTRILILPTRFGLVFSGVAVLTLIGCVNYQLSLGYALTFLLLSLWMISAVHASRALSCTPVSLAVGPGGRTFAGEPVHFPVTLTTSADSEGLPITVKAAGTTLTIEIWAEGVARETLTLPSTRRGIFTLPVVRLSRPDPLGLWRAVQHVNTRSLSLVFPAPEENAPLPPEFAVGTAESFQQRALGDEDFHALRSYVRGDAPGRIAWRHAARTGRLHTKLFDAPGVRALRLSWDATATLRDPEARLSRLTAWVLHAERLGQAFDLELPGESLPPGAGPAHALRALSALALYDPEAKAHRAPVTAHIG